MTVKDIWDYHVATGCPLRRAKVLLSTMPSDLRDRVLMAARQGGNQKWLVDPIEVDPLLADKVRLAAEEAQQNADLGDHHGRGRCHVVWSMQKTILADRYGITWFSPREMNPDVWFD